MILTKLTARSISSVLILGLFLMAHSNAKAGVLDTVNWIVESKAFDNGAQILGKVILPSLLCWMIIRQSKFLKSVNSTEFEIAKKVNETFNDVAGVEDAKEALNTVVTFLKYPEKNTLGAKIPKGVLLIGSPGNGKTLLARAVAGEAGCPVIAVSGSQFVEMFSGKGAAKVRTLFAQAHSLAEGSITKSCVIVIDELDAVGATRGEIVGNAERDQTLNQLLVEMDGFSQYYHHIIVIAATNRPDILDRALLRPGRFDQIVMVPMPNLKTREEILAMRMRSVIVGKDVDIHALACATSNFSGADLVKLVNDAAILATNQGKHLVEKQDFDEAWQSMILGKKLRSVVLSTEERRTIAFHEAGHALVSLLLPTDAAPLHIVTIEPRGRSLGATYFVPQQEKYHTNRYEMLGQITTGLGGRAAEELIFNDITTGVGMDLAGAAKVARKFVLKYGMIDVGHVAYGPNHGEIDKAVHRLLNECYEKAKQLLSANLDKLHKLADALFEKGILTANEIYTLLEMTPQSAQTGSLLLKWPESIIQNQPEAQPTPS